MSFHRLSYFIHAWAGTIDAPCSHKTSFVPPALCACSARPPNFFFGSVSTKVLTYMCGHQWHCYLVGARNVVSSHLSNHLSTTWEIGVVSSLCDTQVVVSLFLKQHRAVAEVLCHWNHQQLMLAPWARWTCTHNMASKLLVAESSQGVKGTTSGKKATVISLSKVPCVSVLILIACTWTHLLISQSFTLQETS